MSDETELGALLCVWDNVEWVSSQYHNEGGISAVAVSVEAATEMVNEHQRRMHELEGGSGDYPPDLEIGEPDAVYVITRPVPVGVRHDHPNAGCC